MSAVAETLRSLSEISLLFLSCDAILSLYNVADETRDLAKAFIYILSVTIVGSCYEAPALCGIVSGGGDTKFVLFNDLIFMWGIVLPLSFLSAFVWHLLLIMIGCYELLDF